MSTQPVEGQPVANRKPLGAAREIASSRNPAAPVANRPPLASELNKRLKAWAGQLKTAAERLGIPYQSLRQSLSQNRFHEASLLTICSRLEFVEKSIAALRTSYDFELKAPSRGARRAEQEFVDRLKQNVGTIGDLFQSMSRQSNYVGRFLETAKEIIPKMFLCLREKDTMVVFLNDQLPTHWDRSLGAKWIPEFVKKLQSGTRVIYLYPSATLATLMAESGYPGMPDPAQVRIRFDHFKEDLLRASSDEAAGNRSAKRISFLTHDCPIVCAPQHRFLLFSFWDPHANNLDFCAIGRFPIVHRDADPMEPASYPAFPLSRPFTTLLLDACVTAVDKFIEGTSRAGEHAEDAMISELQDFRRSVSVGVSSPSRSESSSASKSSKKA